MSLRLTFVAHGSTDTNRAAAFPDDEPLEPKARALTAEAAAAWRLPALAVTSPALRARQTAEALGLSAHVDNNLRDLDYGRWRGCAIADVHASEPEALARWSADPTAAPHGGESIEQLLRRVANWIESRPAEMGHVAVVTHAAVIRCAILHAMAAPATSFWRVDVAPLSRVEVSFAGDHWRLRRLTRGWRSEQ
jgi:broad specificity phosphatase PhoE